MKSFKDFLIILVAFLLTGCYTQLQYSQSMKKVTDEPDRRGYYGEYEEEAEPAEEEYYSDYADEYVPLYYRDYSYAEKYNSCGCNPYNEYNFYGDWYGDFYGPYAYRSHFPYNSYWHYRPYYRHHPFYSGFAFSITWGWGSPYYYHSFYDRYYYDPFYDYYWYNRPYAYNYYYHYYGKYGYGKKDRYDRDSRYGPRSIGTNRVANDQNRSRSNQNLSGRRAAVVNDQPRVRTRSTGTVRTRDNTSVERSRSTTVNGTSARERNRDFTPTERVRNRNNRIENVPNPQRSELREIRHRVRNPQEVESRRRPTFFQRVQGFFENSVRTISRNVDRNHNRSAIRHRSSSSNRSSVSRSQNQSSRSSVSRSRSSSNDSRSRGSSSRSRGGSDRSRD